MKLSRAGRRDLVEVTRIEDGVGPHGGHFWLLTLACNHLKTVRKPVFRAVLQVVHLGNRKQQTQARRLANPNTYLAPQRVKCLMGCVPEDPR